MSEGSARHFSWSFIGLMKSRWRRLPVGRPEVNPPQDGEFLHHVWTDWGESNASPLLWVHSICQLWERRKRTQQKAKISCESAPLIGWMWKTRALSCESAPLMDFGGGEQEVNKNLKLSVSWHHAWADWGTARCQVLLLAPFADSRGGQQRANKMLRLPVRQCHLWADWGRARCQPLPAHG